MFPCSCAQAALGGSPLDLVADRGHCIFIAHCQLTCTHRFTSTISANRMAD